MAKQEKVKKEMEEMKKLQKQINDDKMDLEKEQQALEAEKHKPAELHSVMKEIEKQFDLPKDVSKNVKADPK